MDALVRAVGADAWEGTEAELRALRSRLGGAGAAAARVEAGAPAGGAVPPVSVFVKATVLDAPYLDVMVRHMLAQARYPFAERFVVVDPRTAFDGKYRDRPGATPAALRSVLDGLLSDGVIDRVVTIDEDPARVESTLAAYFWSDAPRVGTHAATGGPIYATLFGLEAAANDRVLQMDADVFFHASGGSWVREALRCLEQDPRVWLAMTHAGPPPPAPMGSAARLARPNRRLARWDGRLRAWRYSTASTRYFLCDRRRLRGKLAFVPQGSACAPLEVCISGALRRHGAFRADVALSGSWDLHAWSHAEPFPSWAAAIAEAVAVGNVPSVQRGHYDLRLDDARGRRAWEAIVAPSRPVASLPSPAPRTVPSDAGIRSAQALSVIVPLRDRAGARVRNALASLAWQTAGRPGEVFVVSQGSRPEVDAELSAMCMEAGARLVTIGRPEEPWCKPLALNTGIRATSPASRWVMTMDVDMILAPDLVAAAIRRLERRPASLVLCRSSDLPPDADLEGAPDALRERFGALRRQSTLRGRHGTGGIQVAERWFFFAVRGYDEDLVWWGAEDGDMVARASALGLGVEWIEDVTAMLHQWHPKRDAVLSDPVRRAAAAAAWRDNHARSRERSGIVVRNPAGWGGVADSTPEGDGARS